MQDNLEDILDNAEDTEDESSLISDEIFISQPETSHRERKHDTNRAINSMSQPSSMKATFPNNIKATFPSSMKTNFKLFGDDLCINKGVIMRDIRGMGPFSIFNLTFSRKETLRNYTAWQKLTKEEKKEYADIYYSQFRIPLTYDFKMYYLKMLDQFIVRRKLPASPYLLWLMWYLKEKATSELLNKDVFDIAIELGHRWNMLSNKSKLVWESMITRAYETDKDMDERSKQIPGSFLKRFK